MSNEEHVGSLLSPEAFVEAYKQQGSIKAVARHLGRNYSTIRAIYLKAVEQGLMAPLQVGRKSNADLKNPPVKPEPPMEGRVHGLPVEDWYAPDFTGVRRYLFTCAQNNTVLHDDLWNNLLVMADHYNARICVARFTYVKSGLGAQGDKARVLRKEDLYGGTDMWWDERLVPYFLDRRVKLAPSLVWCGEMNTLPTAARPLSGLEVYAGGDNSGIFPHVKIAMESVATMKGEHARHNYTTGTVTLRNYIQRKAGLKAEFHHCFGALLVEVLPDGTWFARQVNADSAGTIQDLNVRVAGGEVETGCTVEAITWGDIHYADMDVEVAQLAWGTGTGGMMDSLMPDVQFFHDVLDFKSRSHHDSRDPHRRFLRHITAEEDVRDEVEYVVAFLRRSYSVGCMSVVVDSNHHHHLGRWLKEQDGRMDPVNAQFWIEMQRAVYSYMEEKVQEPNFLEEAVGLVDKDIAGDLGIKFLREDESFIICGEYHGGIECGIHGHNGPNGSRGNARALAKMGRRATVGHSHQAGIVDGLYVTGTCGSLTPDWTSGPGSWSHSHVVTYRNGKRTVVTMCDGRWRA